MPRLLLYSSSSNRQNVVKQRGSPPLAGGIRYSPKEQICRMTFPVDIVSRLCVLLPRLCYRLPAEAMVPDEQLRKGVLEMETQKWNVKQKKLLLCLGLVFLLLLISSVTVQAASSKTIYLDWHAVVPAGSGDPNMFGDGTVSVNAGQMQICYNLRVFVYPGDGSNWPPTSTGIYQAEAGSNGPLVVDLHPDFSSGPNASGCVNISNTLAHNIQKNPSYYYILVTSINHPDGAVRAQLIK